MLSVVPQKSIKTVFTYRDGAISWGIRKKIKISWGIGKSRDIGFVPPHILAPLFMLKKPPKTHVIRKSN